jgi:deoxyribonuclease-4
LRPGPLLGFHVSISGSIDLAVDRAQEMGCTTFQIFTRNPRGWAFRPLDEEQAGLFKQKRKKASFAKVVAHMPYLPNLSASVKPYQKKCRASLTARRDATCAPSMLESSPDSPVTPRRAIR